MGQRGSSISTIAELAGVSTTTVHRALTGKQEISAETRAKVLVVAEEVGYRPSLVARTLATGRSATVGIVMPGLHGSFYSEITQGTEAAAAQQEYSVLLGFSQDSWEKEREQIEVFLEKSVEGLIVFPCTPEENREFFRSLHDEGIPLVFVARSVPGVKADLVAADNVRGGYLAGSHLAKLGRKKIVFLAGMPRKIQGTSRQGRIEGCNQALAAAGIAPCELLCSPAGTGNDEDRYGYAAVTEYLKAGNSFDGLFARNDLLACGAMAAGHDWGLSVPEDVSIIGFDDQDIAAYLRPALTTIRQPMRQIGERAVELLLRRIEGGEESLPGQEVLLQPELVVRGSCGGNRQLNKSDLTEVPLMQQA